MEIEPTGTAVAYSAPAYLPDLRPGRYSGGRRTHRPPGRKHARGEREGQAGQGRAGDRGPRHHLLVVEVADDGCGGADPTGGSGLTGPADRVAAVDGRMLLSSPVGGPTLVQVEIPCGV